LSFCHFVIGHSSIACHNRFVHPYEQSPSTLQRPARSVEEAARTYDATEPAAYFVLEALQAPAATIPTLQRPAQSVEEAARTCSLAALACAGIAIQQDLSTTDINGFCPQRPAQSVEAAARTYDAAALAYAGSANCDTNFPPTPAALAALGQPVRVKRNHETCSVVMYVLVTTRPSLADRPWRHGRAGPPAAACDHSADAAHSAFAVTRALPTRETHVIER